MTSRKGPFRILTPNKRNRVPAPRPGRISLKQKAGSRAGKRKTKSRLEKAFEVVGKIAQSKEAGMSVYVMGIRFCVNQVTDEIARNVALRLNNGFISQSTQNLSD